jgi:signal transduction histidine kinase
MLKSGSGVAFLVGIVLLLTMACSFGALVTARDMERLMEAIATRNLPSVEAAADLQTALLQQRGLVAAYMLDDGRLAWVNDLDRMKPSVARAFARARAAAHTGEEQKILALLTGVYKDYDQQREKAIALYHEGHRAEGRQLLLGEVSLLADQAHDLCRQLVSANERSMSTFIRQGHERVGSLAVALTTGVALATLLSFVLLLVVFRRLLLPVRRLARDAKRFSKEPSTAPGTRFTDDLHELEYYSRALMSDMTQTRTDLVESQRRLLVAEKLAAVGKFAACAAHEIRNPLTAMKLWLHQIRQRAGDDPDTHQSCAVLEEEMGRLEDLATSFLQFSRPPSLDLAPQCITEIVDRTLELARHQLDRKRLTMVRVNGTPLPPVMGDAHQLRQVLFNLVVNAADAAPEGSEVRIAESRESADDGRAEVVVRIHNDGPGIPPTLWERMFEPFVTSKPNGTGLGLAVASSIMTQHGGRLVLESSNGSGTVFAVHLAACGD